MLALRQDLAAEPKLEVAAGDLDIGLSLPAPAEAPNGAAGLARTTVPATGHPECKRKEGRPCSGTALSSRCWRCSRA